MSKKDKMVLVLKKYNLTGSLIMGLLCLAGAILFSKMLFVLAFLFIFNYYDLVGYSILLESENHYNIDDTNDLKTPAYRIIQFMFQIVLLFSMLVISKYNYFVLLSMLIAHWFGAQDCLYYIVGRMKIPGILTWLNWTPLGLIKKTKSLKKWQFILQATLGIILGLAISLL